MNRAPHITPLAWVPTLYFAQGIPYFLVNHISVLMLAKMGVPNGRMALFTSLLYLPWVVKPFWSPFIDLVRTKRWWVVCMQWVMAGAFLLLTLSVPTPDAATLLAGQTPVSLFTVALLLFIATAFASATHDIAADGFYMLALTPRGQAAWVGWRSTFYRLAGLFGQGVLVWIAGTVEKASGDIPLSWRVTLLMTALLFAALSLYHTFVMPRPAGDTPVRSVRGTKADAATLMQGFGRTFTTYFRKPGVCLALLFMLLYRLPEAFLLKMCTPFLVASRQAGGLGLSTQDVGWIYGGAGVFFLTAGGILGGIYAARKGLKRSLWLMAGFMTLPCATFVYLSVCQPSGLLPVVLSLAVEQFGYGFGFTAYMLYMMHFSEGEFQTSHYAISTAFMAASMWLPGMVAGYLQEALGYGGFFLMVMVCCLATIGVTCCAERRIDPGYGKKQSLTKKTKNRRYDTDS